MQRKNFAATGSFIADDRPRALDLIGVASQLVFNTFHNRRLRNWEHGSDIDLAYGVARAHNRGMVEFCSWTPACCQRCTCAASGRFSTRGRTGAGHGRRHLLVASGCPQAPLPESSGSTPSGSVPRGGRAVVFHVRGHR